MSEETMYRYDVTFNLKKSVIPVVVYQDIAALNEMQAQATARQFLEEDDSDAQVRRVSVTLKGIIDDSAGKSDPDHCH